MISYYRGDNGPSDINFIKKCWYQNEETCALYLPIFSWNTIFVQSITLTDGLVSSFISIITMGQNFKSFVKTRNGQDTLPITTKFKILWESVRKCRNYMPLQSMVFESFFWWLNIHFFCVAYFFFLKCSNLNVLQYICETTNCCNCKRCGGCFHWFENILNLSVV